MSPEISLPISKFPSRPISQWAVISISARTVYLTATSPPVAILISIKIPSSTEFVAQLTHNVAVVVVAQPAPRQKLRPMVKSSEVFPVAAIATLSQKFGHLIFKEDAFKEKEKEFIKDIKSDFEDKGKSKAQRLRGVLYRVWEQKSEGYKTPDDHYNHHMEKIIIHFKDKLD